MSRFGDTFTRTLDKEVFAIEMNNLHCSTGSPESLALIGQGLDSVVTSPSAQSDP